MTTDIENITNILSPKVKTLLIEVESQKLIEQKFSHMSDNELHDLISTVAYLKSEDNGFMAGNEVGDWLEAEKIVKGYIT